MLFCNAMNDSSIKALTSTLLSQAGITLNGSNPWDIQVHNDNFFARVIKQGSLGLGESYMEKWWSCKRLDAFFERVIRAKLEDKIKASFSLILKVLFAKLFNQQSKRRAFIVGKHHYDLGNDLYQKMLDSRMVYSCGYWKNATDLEQAQYNKLDLSCKKLKLKPGIRVLDIGCGWGSFAKFAAENYDVEVTGITISKQQGNYAKALCKGLPVQIHLCDYRELDETFDRVVSIGMFEHVGHHNYKTYMEVVNKCLKNQGLFLLHTIGINKSRPTNDEWIAKYIFPNGVLPSIAQIAKASEDFFVMEDWHSFGPDYDKTLLAWHQNFNQHWSELESKYDDTFFRMWNYYLLSCAGSFRARHTQLWQAVFSKGGVKGGYVHGATDEFGFQAVEQKVHVHDLHATILHLLGFDHTRLTYRHASRDFRLTDVYGEVVHDLIV